MPSSADIEALVSKQSIQGDEIQKIVANYKKDPAERKNKAYYVERLRRLEASWERFESTDSEIRTMPDPPLANPYFAQGFYEAIRAVHEKYCQHFQEKIRALEVEPKKQLEVQKPPPRLTTNESPQQMHTDSSDDDHIRIMRRQKGLIESLCRLLAGISISDQHPKQYYEFKMDAIKQLWTQAETQNYAIWELSDDPAQEGYDIDKYIQLEAEVQNTLIQLSTKLDSMSSATMTTQTSMDSTLKLPTITIPRFDGDYSKWKQFSDLFTQLIHNQPMANCQKLWYLKTNITGEAEKLIRHLSLSNENYLSAWKMLQDRYENTRLLVAVLINKLLSQPSHTSDGTSYAAIKSLHDVTKECLLGLENLGIPTNSWDPLLLHVLIKKLDRNTHTLYEQSLEKPRELQTMEHFLTFLENRFQSLEALGAKGKSQEDHSRRHAVRTLTSVIALCVACKGEHQLFACKVFLNMTPNGRFNLLKKNNLCINCMKPGHNHAKCPSRGCTICTKKHNSLVHFEDVKKTNKPTPEKSSISAQSEDDKQAEITNRSISLTSLTTTPRRCYVLLSTAIVRLVGQNGKTVQCRAILDSGSQINIVSERVIKRLGLTTLPESMCIQGIGQGRQKAHKRVTFLLQSRLNGFSERVEAHVLQNIISPQPTQALDISTWDIPKNIKLADPEFNHPGSIDVLLGAEFYHQILSIGQIKLTKNLPILQNTAFGWIVSGRIDNIPLHTAMCGVCTEDDINQAIEKFWKIEEIEPSQPVRSPAEKKCELHFLQTTNRNAEGRYVVRLPFADEPAQLGESKDIATRRFLSLERRLNKNTELKRQYVEFMEEYLTLKHMEEVNIEQIQAPLYFLPHHSVLKPDSSSTKLRVVFDASAKSSSNVSLNDVLHAGPVVQDELFSILLRFRMPRFVFTADIQKMSRQILIHQDDRKYQLIVWRSDPTQPLKHFQLCTVTYGTKSAPYLATKCLQKLAQDRATTYHLGSRALQQDCYVDDIMTGSNSIGIAIETQNQLISMLKEAGFKLRKWCSNDPRLLQGIPPADQEVQLNFSMDTEAQIKILGLTWLPKSDQFCVRSSWPDSPKITKRTIMSDIARLFDPLGMLAPVIVSAKILLQQLWQLKVDWDASLPMDIHTRWTAFREELRTLDNVQFPRHVFAHEISTRTQIHAFADASERAYGAAIYIRSVMKNGVIVVRLLCAKSRVAPLKKLSLPRLELCAAKLATELTNRVKEDLKQEDIDTYYWTDSEIVLDWINSKSCAFHTFVANRIACIQELTNPQQWRHVTSKNNPADALSRGVSPHGIASHHLWFYGPQFLHGNESIWPPHYHKGRECDLERRQAVSLATTVKNNVSATIIEGINHGNSFRKIQRVVAYVLKFIQHIKALRKPAAGEIVLTTLELDEALQIIVKTMQGKEFEDEILQLRQHKEVGKGSSLSNLAPFLDQNGILRVGGRLESSLLPFDTKHPMLLPYGHQFTKLLMNDIHKENLHLGPQALLAQVRQRFWPIKGKTIARSVVQNCVRCARAKPKMLTQIMGNLPPLRVQPARPFVNSGVDFCGPLWVHYHARGKKPQKSYIAVFCCFSTKAVHLELVSDLSTNAFIGALKRFMGRRGRCKNLFCDNATNFVGARNKLEELHETIYSKDAKESIRSACSQRNVDFHFIPPRAPHFGGLWEAAVKSAKYILQRSVTSAGLTYEELGTVIIEVEAILNSRPITPMSADPNDLSALTPGHFLIGEPLTANIDPNAQPIKKDLLTRWKMVSYLKHEFWRRWTSEYLNELQHRLKWKQKCQNIELGTMVILKEDNVPVLKWPLGRVIQTYKGNDGNVRVVDIRTANGVLKRPIHRLSPLPCEPDHTEDLPPTDNVEPKKLETGRSSTNPAHTQITTDSTTQPPKPTNPRKKARGMYGSSIVTLLLACLLLPVTRASPIEIEQFKAHPGLHFDNMGKLNLISTEWNLIVYYDLNPYWMEFTALSNGTKALNHLCSQLRQKAACNPLVTQFQHINEELSRENELLLNQKTSERHKRGAFNIVGNIANSLFGVLDSEYAEKMSQTIDNIKINEEHLITLLKNQTSVIDSTINIIRKDQAAVEKKFQDLDNQITQLSNRVRDTGEELYQVKIFQLFSSLVLQMMMVSSNLQRIQSAIVEVITDAHHGKINPLLLSPQKLKVELTTIKNHLSPSYRLPVDQDDILGLYTLMTAKSRIFNNHVIFQLKVPLMSLEVFDLFKLVSIPALVNNTLLAFDSHSNLLATNLHRDQCYTLSEQELLLCSTMRENNYLCNQMHPIYHKGSGACICEMNLLNHIPITDECTIKAVDSNPVWIQLTNKNNWIYAVRTRTPTNVVCGNEAFPLMLEGSGLL